MTMIVFQRITFTMIALLVVKNADCYEINNHGDMSQQALLMSSLGTGAGPNGKLFRVGVRPLDVQNPDQKFVLDANLPAIPYCFGSYLPGNTG